MLLAPAGAQQSAYTQAGGYRVQVTDLKAGGVAVSPGGRLAVAQHDSGGAAAITIHSSIEPAGRTVLRIVRAPAGDLFRFFGGMVFRDDDTLIFAENGDMDTVYAARVSTGEVQSLAPKGSLPAVDPIAIRPTDGLLVAGTSGGPGKNAVYTIADGQARPLATSLGLGFLGGLAFDPAGRLFVGDTADPEYAGKPGQILELRPDGTVRRTISLAAGGGSGVGGLACDAEGDLIASTGATLTHVRLHGVPRVTEFGRFSGQSPFPGGLAFRGTRFEPGSGDAVLLVNAAFTDVGSVLAVTPTADRPTLPTDFAGRVVAFDGTNGTPNFNLRPEAALGPPSPVATPTVPDNSEVVSFGWGGSITLAFDRPILNDPRHPDGYDFSVYGNSLYAGGNENVTFQEPAYVEVGLDANDNGVPDPGEPFYLLRGVPDPGSPPRFPLPETFFGSIDHRTTPMRGYADVSPTLGTGDPLVPDVPGVAGITPGSAGGDAFDLGWAVDAEGRPVALDHADFVRITHALNVSHPAFGRSATEIDAVSLVRPR
jgi:hypothetical protein